MSLGTSLVALEILGSFNLRIRKKSSLPHIFPGLGRLRQADLCEFEASLVTTCLVLVPHAFNPSTREAETGGSL